MGLARQGLICSKDARSWHSHALRHSFRTEASHAGLEPGMAEYFLGHTEGIRFIYDHTADLHPEDFAKEYKRVEPFVSLDEKETTVREKYDQRERLVLKELLDLKRKVEELEKNSIDQSMRRSPS